MTRAIRAGEVCGRWASSQPLRELLTAFGGDLDGVWRESEVPDPDGDWLHNETLPAWVADLNGVRKRMPGALLPTLELLRRMLLLEQWAVPRFNFRDGAVYLERNQASAGNIDAAVGDVVLDTADALGLRRSTRPHYLQYDHTLVLGGGWRSPLRRSRYAALWRDEGTDLGSLWFLGSPRFLLTDPPERDRTDSYAPGAVDEYDLMVAGATSEFGLSASDAVLLCGCSSMDRMCPAWPHADSVAAGQTPPHYTHERSLILLDADARAAGAVLSARTGRPPLRPDTTDTLALWARQAAPRPGMRVLVVTTQVFVPFQTFDSLKRLYLVHGVDVDVIGYAAEWGGGDRPDTPEYLLQETLSAIRSARRLLVAALTEFAD